MVPRGSLWASVSRMMGGEGSWSWRVRRPSQAPLSKREAGGPDKGPPDGRRLVLGAVLGCWRGVIAEEGASGKTWLERFQDLPPTLPILHVPNLSESPQDLGLLPSNLYLFPRHLAPSQIGGVCQLGGRGVWAHWLHRIHGGE